VGTAVPTQPCITYVKAEAAITVFELLMMNAVSLETCSAIKKHWNNKFYYTVASCWLFLYDLFYDARIHKHQVYYKPTYAQISGANLYKFNINLHHLFVRMLVYNKHEFRTSVPVV